MSENIRIRCEQCKQENLLSKMLVERSLPAPFDTDKAVEGVLVCPDCGLEKHSYFLSSKTRWERTKMIYEISQMPKDKTPEDIRRISLLRAEYIKIFDAEQEKYREFLEKAAA